MKLRLRTISIMLLALALASYLAEIIFFNKVNANGLLEESFFLPLSYIVASIGLLLLIISLFRKSHNN